RTTIVELLTVLGGGAVIAAAVMWGRRGPIHGATSLVLLAALAVLTSLSVLWSVVPELTYVEAGRTLAYLVVFAAAIAGARLAPRGAPGVLGGILIGAILVVAYALASRMWPGALAEDELSNRIGAPFQYWNAVGTVAALAIPAALWLGSRRTGSMVARALAYPAIGLCVLAILLTQSRGALGAAIVVALLWLAIVPLRLRSLPVLLAPALGASAVGAWALSKDPFSKSLQPLQAKEAIAGDFGLLVVLMSVLLLAVGVAVNMGLSRGVVSMRTRQRAGMVAVAVVCLVPLVVFTSVAFSDRGLSGTIDDRVSELTSETEVAPDEGGDRVFASSSTRGKYWREAGRVFDDRPAVGVGAGAFAVARLRHRTDGAVTRHAHGFVPQTLADLGIAGVVLTTLLLLAWVAAMLRTTSLLPRRLPFAERMPFARAGGEPPPRRDWDGDRIALVALSLVAIAFGLQSIIDWTWFINGPATMALVAAGFVAGRGPQAALAGVAPARLGSRPETGRIVAAAGVGLTAIVLAWTIWQPEASDRATGSALELSDQGRFDEAVAKTQDAADTNPLTPEPLLVRAAVQTSAGQESQARETLERAVLSFPGDPGTWYRLAAFQLGTLDRPDLALETLRGALYLDRFSKPAQALFLESRARQRELATLEARRAQQEQQQQQP
ncbi:MAG TPA: O-antigen ligase family protein, partial [Thermoleophilaceae bacterium]|nr:O-antigen ligase family protein [Thermoleophilaceae bacterium]